LRERIGAEADSLEKCEEPGGPERDGILALLSTVLGLGRDSLSASASARRLLKNFGTAAALTQASLEEIRVRGKLSPRQASSLRAALLLGQRLCSSPLKPGEKFSNSRDIFRCYRARFFAASKEHFFSLHLNSKNRLIREVLVSVGASVRLSCTPGRFLRRPSVTAPRRFYSCTTILRAIRLQARKIVSARNGSAARAGSWASVSWITLLWVMMSTSASPTPGCSQTPSYSD